MKIERHWTMPNKWTYRIPIVRALLKEYVCDGKGWADPFAGKSDNAEFRNDLNPHNAQPSQREAADFLAGFDAGSLRGVLFDPPYSLTQVARSYEECGYKFAGKENPTGGFPLVREHIARVLEPNGLCISFGWNTCGIGTERGMDGANHRSLPRRKSQ
jgi:hypothetical protein